MSLSNENIGDVFEPPGVVGVEGVPGVRGVDGELLVVISKKKIGFKLIFSPLPKLNYLTSTIGYYQAHCRSVKLTLATNSVGRVDEISQKVTFSSLAALLLFLMILFGNDLFWTEKK